MDTSRRRASKRGLWAAVAAFVLSVFAPLANAETATIAVAANFAEAARELGALYEKQTGDRIPFSVGSSGQLYTQISQGAAFDAFLSADQERPKQAVAAGFAVPNTVFTYATGRLVLFSTEKNLINGADTLKEAVFGKIAIANPVTAPYAAWVPSEFPGSDAALTQRAESAPAKRTRSSEA